MQLCLKGFHIRNLGWILHSSVKRGRLRVVSHGMQKVYTILNEEVLRKLKQGLHQTGDWSQAKTCTSLTEAPLCMEMRKVDLWSHNRCNNMIGSACTVFCYKMKISYCKFWGVMEAPSYLHNRREVSWSWLKFSKTL